MSIYCPKCKTELYEMNIEGADLDFCSNCKGLWFDNDELIYYLKAHSGNTEVTFQMKIVRQTELPCPRCANLLDEMKFSEQHDLLIDHCSRCRGIWLDEGELKKAKEITAQIADKNSRMYMVMETLQNQQPPKKSGKLVPLAIFVAGMIASPIFYHTFFRPAKSSVQEKKVAPVSLSEKFPLSQICNECKGKGKKLEICLTCNGLGQLAKTGTSSAQKSTCPECSGRGTVVSARQGYKCGYCNGMGWTYTPDKQCSRCGGTGQIQISNRRTCYSCNGAGQVSVQNRCQMCGGSGRSDINPQWHCPNCNGSGYTQTKKTCPSCLGGVIDNPQNKSCPDCKGIGHIPSAKKSCKQCYGTGESDSTATIPCRRCSGSGIILTGGSGSETCESCWGKGNLGEVDCATCNGKGTL